MDSECLYPNYIACYGAFRDFTKFTFVYVSFSQIFVGKFELWREAWGDWGYWRNGGIRWWVGGVGNMGLVTGNMEVKHNMSFAYSLCMGDSTGSLGRSYLISYHVSQNEYVISSGEN